MKIPNPFRFVSDILAAFIYFKTKREENDEFLRQRRKLQGSLARDVIMKHLADADRIRMARIKRERRYSRYRSKRQNKHIGTITDRSYLGSSIAVGSFSIVDQIAKTVESQTGKRMNREETEKFIADGFFFEPANG